MKPDQMSGPVDALASGVTSREIEEALRQAREELLGVTHGGVKIIFVNGRFDRTERLSSRKRDGVSA